MLSSITVFVGPAAIIGGRRILLTSVFLSLKYVILLMESWEDHLTISTIIDELADRDPLS